MQMHSHIQADQEEADYATSDDIKQYQPKKDFFSLTEGQKTALAVTGAVVGAVATGAAAYGAYQYANTPKNDPYQEIPGKSYYTNVLGVNENASQQEIRKAYLNLAREHHPDKNIGDPLAEARFKEIKNAYDYLHNQ